MVRAIIYFLIGMIVLSGCSSCMMKQECANTNWFEHSKKIALQGKYLEEDDRVLRCSKIDEVSHRQIDLGFKEGRDQYCNLDKIYQNALQGTPVNFKMCENLSPKNMQARFTEGLKSFCTADSGYRYGSSGETYKNVCNPEQEKSFIPSYHKGRSNYLSNYIQDRKELLQTLERQEGHISDEIGRLSREISSLPQVLDCRREVSFNKATNRNEEQKVCEEPTYVKHRRENLYDRMSRMRSDRDESSRKIKTTASEIEWAKTELAKIPK